MELDNLFDGSMTDEEIVNVLESWYRGNPNIDKSKFVENFETLRLPKIVEYLEELKKSNTYLADNPKVLEGILSKIKDICGSKK